MFRYCAFSYGIPRLLLTRHLNLNGLKFLSRWFETTEEIVGYENKCEDLARLVRLNLQEPVSTLIPRQVLLNNLDKDIKQLLLIKY